MAGDSLIVARGLVKRYGAVTVLHGIDLDVRRGEVLCIIGPSGSGKSTLLRCLNFLEDYAEGEVLVGGTLLGYRIDADGRRMPDSPAAVNRLRRGIAMVFQQFNLWPHMTVLQNVAQPLRAGAAQDAAPRPQAIAMRALGKVGLAGRSRGLPGAALRRAAAARRHRPRAGHRSVRHPVRRAHLLARSGTRRRSARR